MTTQEKFVTIVKKALGEMAAVDCTLEEYVEGLDNAKGMFNKAILDVAEEVKAEG